MIDYRKLLVIERGELGYIQDHDGSRVDFASLEDMSRCCGIDFTQKFYVGYEPDIDFFVDSRDPNLQPETDNSAYIPYQPYEDLIAMIPTLIARRDDPTYGLSPEDAKDAAVAWALNELKQYYTSLLYQHGVADSINMDKKSSKLVKLIRKEAKGTATPQDIQILEDNDTLDDWLDSMETAMETQGEQWIEDPARTSTELMAFNPATDITWPTYPF